jgi:predicted DCC family thiol-disulfide oxidoreductase YuxK
MKLTTRPPSSAKGLVLYDGQCAFCRKSVSILKRLDWGHHLTFQDCRDASKLPATEPPLQPDRLIEEMHLVTPDHKGVYAGFRAFRWIAARLPMTWALVPLMYLPGIPQLGQKIYLWVAKNRFKLVPCHDGVCQIPLKKKA